MSSTAAKPRVKTRDIVSSEKRALAARRKPAKSTVHGLEIPEKEWLTHEFVKDLSRKCGRHEDRLTCELMLMHWPPSDGDAWFDRGKRTVQWRDTQPGEDREILIPLNVVAVWTQKPPPRGLPPMKLTRQGFVAEPVVRTGTELTVSQRKKLDRECEAIGVTVSEMIRIALARFGAIDPFDERL